MLRQLPQPCARSTPLAPWLACAAALLCAAATTALAGDPEWVQSGLSPESLQAGIAELASDTTLNPTQRTRAKAELEACLELLQRTATRRQQALDARKRAERADEVSRELEARGKSLGLPLPRAGLDLAELEQGLAQAEGALSKARDLQERLRQGLAQRGERRVALERRASALEARAESPVSDQRPSSALEAAEALHAVALQRDLNAELDAIRDELKLWDEGKTILVAELELSGQRVEQSDRARTAWEQATSRARQEKARGDAREAERVREEVIARFPPLRSLGEEVGKLAALRAGEGGTVTRLEVLARELASARATLGALRRRRASVEAKVAAAGLTNSVGLLLRKELDLLPSERALREAIAGRQDELADLQYQLIVRGEESQRPPEEELQGVLRALGAQPTAQAEAAARELVDRRAELIGSLLEDHERTFQRLVDLDTTTQSLADASGDYRSYIRERILWVRSVTGRSSLTDLKEGATWLLKPAAWSRGLGLSLSSALDAWLESTLVILALIALLGLSLWTRGKIRAMAERVSQDPSATLGLTLRASGMVLARALALPGLLVFAGQFLLAPPEQSPQVVAAAHGLLAAGFSLFAYELLRQVIHPDGLAERHFQWSEEVCAFLRRHLRWFVPIKVAVVLLVVACDTQRVSDLWNESLGRAVFVVGALAQALFLALVLRPSGPVFSALGEGESWASRLRYPAAALAFGAALSLALTAGRGYYYTALQLEARLHAWLWLLLGGVLLHALGTRWLRAGRPVQAQAPGPIQQDSTTPEGQAREAAERARELVGVDLEPAGDVEASEAEAQSRSVLRAFVFLVLLLGSYAVWSETFPALKRLERVELYPTLRVRPAPDEPRPRLEALPLTPAPTPEAKPTAEAPPAALGPAPTSAPPSAASPGRVVTLAGALLALCLLAFTVIAVRNVPGLLEWLVLRRLPLDAGGRYAAVSLTRYALVLGGGALAAGRVGIGWDSVQWLAAALTFGLAFGLQEIFANFISGLIILFERPVRIGDVVTVNGTSGVVTRIRMRATTVTDFDRRELIVPNKAFVTGEVLNWVLSDAVVRVVIPVGVSYDADVEVARKVMLSVARRHRLALKDPAPACLLRGMGSSTYDFEVWLFVARAEDMNVVRHEVNRDLFRALSEKGIDLPFPQQDVHLRTAPGHAPAPATPPPSPATPPPSPAAPPPDPA